MIHLLAENAASKSLHNKWIETPARLRSLSMDSSAQAVWPTASCMQRYMFFPLWTVLLYLLWRFRKKQKVNHSEPAINGWSLRMSTWAVLAHFVPLEGSGNLCGDFYFRFFPAFQEHNARLEDTQNISLSTAPFVIRVTRPTWTTPQTLQLKWFIRWFWGCSCLSRKTVTCSNGFHHFY